MKNFNKKTAIISSGALGILAASIGAASYADGKFGSDYDDNPAYLVEQANISIDEAMDIALNDMQGTVYEIELENEDGKAVWEIELVGQDQQVYEFEIAANDGRILEKEIERH